MPISTDTRTQSVLIDRCPRTTRMEPPHKPSPFTPSGNAGPQGGGAPRCPDLDSVRLIEDLASPACTHGSIVRIIGEIGARLVHLSLERCDQHLAHLRVRCIYEYISMSKLHHSYFKVLINYSELPWMTSLLSYCDQSFESTRTTNSEAYEIHLGKAASDQPSRPIESKSMAHPAQTYDMSMHQPPPYAEHAESSGGSFSVPSTSSTISFTQSSLGPTNNHRIIAIPSTTPKLGSPFLRAYPPALDQYTISRDLFLRFVDDMNRAIVASPPLQVLGLAGNVVSQAVPLATAQIVGGAVSAAATFGTIAVSKGRMEVFLRDSNRTIFNPRGLKVEIVKLEALATAAEMPILAETGKIDKKASLLKPIEDVDVSVTGQQRRLDALEPWIAELDLEPLPQIATPDNPLSKWSASASEKQRTKDEEKMVKKRHEAHEKHAKETAKAKKELEKEIKKLDKEEGKARRKEDGKKLEEELRKVKKEREKAQKEFDKKTGEAEKDRKKDDKEEKHMHKILWLMITKCENTTGDNGVDIIG